MTDTATLTRAYIEAVGKRDLAPLDALFDDGLVAVFAGAEFDKVQWTQALHRLLPVLVRNDIRELFTEGDHACVVYDFVTDTAAGAVTCVELVTVTDGTIRRVELILDRVAFAPVNARLSELAG
jgi:ketosteroid isomerase-like protein